MEYEVKLDAFEGPLDLLLHLIKKHEVDILDIPIALITQQFLESIEMMKLMDLDVAGEFILMAATLMHIKSKLLLPPDEVEEGEEEEEDPRAELVRRLLEYKKYKEAAHQLGDRDLLERENFLRGFFEEIEGEEEDASFAEVGLFDLVEAFKEVLKTISSLTPHQISLEKVSVKEKMDVMLERVKKDGSITFHSLFERDTSRADMVATFLALLELIKMRTIRAFQGENFGTIRVMTNETLH